MTIEQLADYETEAIDRAFGGHLVEEIATCTELEPLLNLAVLIDIKIAELANGKNSGAMETAQK